MSTDRRSRAWVDVDAAALSRNLSTIRDAMGPRGQVMPMVKADAYGLGVAGAVRTLERADPWGYGVATVGEGRTLRELGVTRPVLVCSPIPPDSYDLAVEAELIVGLSDLRGLGSLEAAASRVGRTAAYHVEIDTGMGRAGFDWGRAAEWGSALDRAEGSRLRWRGCFTHLHSADLKDPTSVEAQWGRFREALSDLRPPAADFVVHVANSAGALRMGETLPPLARPGVFLYGGSAGEGLPAPHRMASLRARVVFTREASAGSTLGYGSTYRAEKPERWAALSIGYGDGLPRALGQGGHALIHGRRVPIIGRISMDATVVNISDLHGVELGDVATLIGCEGDEEITVDEVAELSGTIAYEILTGLTARLPRIWSDDEDR